MAEYTVNKLQDDNKQNFPCTDVLIRIYHCILRCLSVENKSAQDLAVEEATYKLVVCCK